MNLFNLTGITALVTGGGTGLGLGMATALLSAGAKVALAGRRLEKLNAAVESLAPELKTNALGVQLDVTEDSSIKGAITQIEESLGPIGVLVNNAGNAYTGTVLQSDRDLWANQLETNVIGLSQVSRHVAAHMIETNTSGSIINIASILGVRSNIGSAAYCASKSAVIGLTRTMALEFAKKNIRVNAILPGVFKTDLADWMDNEAALDSVRSRVPTGKIGVVEDLAGPILLLASNAGAHMTGAVIPVDGGHLIASL
ncbi:MAG: SDR family NAD(P)-dependent oxidoreductase [Halieaceae bacterium]|nr:SDR family NAD(P)-dependent oxidoreductase [Halieaceae bacterium]